MVGFSFGSRLGSCGGGRVGGRVGGEWVVVVAGSCGGEFVFVGGGDGERHHRPRPLVDGAQRFQVTHHHVALGEVV